jgi:hypothetical protein
VGLLSWGEFHCLNPFIVQNLERSHFSNMDLVWKNGFKHEGHNKVVIEIYKNYFMALICNLHVHVNLCVVGLYQMPHSNQDTQASIKSYHGALKQMVFFLNKRS